MILGRQLPAGQWRFLQLTIFICGWMLLSPLFQYRWITQSLLQGFLLTSVLVTLWINPEGTRSTGSYWRSSKPRSGGFTLPSSSAYMPHSGKRT